MDAARVLRQARRRAGLTQRELASRAAVAQSVVGRIESGAVIPRVDTLDRLLAAAGQGLEPTPRPGQGLDRSGYAEHLVRSPRARVEEAARDARGLARLLERTEQP
jgi:transcriptional regulator with XRE-family HTH domain